MRLKLGLVLSYAQAKLIPALIMMASIPLITAQYGSPVYGEYSRTWAVAIIASSLTTGWLQQGLLRYAGVAEVQLSSIPLLLRAFTWLITGMITGLAAAVQPSTTGTTFRFATGFAFGAAWCWSVVRETNAQRDQRVRFFAIGGVARAAGVGVLPFVASMLPVPRTVSTVLLAGAIGAAVAGVLYHVGATRSVCASKSTTEKLARFGWPMSLWLGLSSVLLYLDRWILAAFVDPDTAGDYAAFSDLVVRGFTMIGMPLSLAIHPHIMALANTHDHSTALDSLRGLRRLAGLGLAVAIPPAVIVLSVSQEWLVGTDTFPSSAIAFLSAGAAAWQFALLWHKEQELANRTPLMLLALAVSLGVEAVVLVTAVPAFGVLGASVGLAAGALTYIAGIGVSRLPPAPADSFGRKGNRVVGARRGKT